MTIQVFYFQLEEPKYWKYVSINGIPLPLYIPTPTPAPAPLLVGEHEPLIYLKSDDHSFMNWLNESSILRYMVRNYKSS